MTEIRWNAAQVRPGDERTVQKAIEETERAAFVPTHVRGWYVGKHKRFRERPLIPGYVLFAAPANDAGWGAFTQNRYGERQATVLGRVSDEDSVGRLMLAHAMGKYNAIQSRDNQGRFGPVKQFRQKKRRRRPRHGKKYASNSANIQSHPRYGT